MSTVTSASDKYSVHLGNLGGTLTVAPEESESGVAVIEHTLPEGMLAAPLHRHSREDEISYVLEGEMTVLADDEISTVSAGDYVVKGRDVWHTFWNAGDEPLRFLEIVSPGDFAGYFEELSEAIGDSGLDESTIDPLMEISGKYGIEMRPESVPELCQEYGLRM